MADGMNIYPRLFFDHAVSSAAPQLDIPVQQTRKDHELEIVVRSIPCCSLDHLIIERETRNPKLK